MPVVFHRAWEVIELFDGARVFAIHLNSQPEFFAPLSLRGKTLVPEHFPVSFTTHERVFFVGHLPNVELALDTAAFQILLGDLSGLRCRDDRGRFCESS